MPGAARLQLSYLDADQLDVQVGNLGKTLREQLVGYEQALQEVNDMKAWFLVVVLGKSVQDGIDWLKYLIKSVVSSLPSNKDWLDPDIEKAMRSIKD